LLLDNGADPNTRDSAGDPVLFIPAKSGDLESLAELIKKAPQ
jgi:ankyrin repeat protein